MIASRLFYLLFPFLAAWLTALAGCTGSASSDPAAALPSEAAVEVQNREVSRRLFESAVEMMNRLDDYGDRQLESAVEQMVRRLNESMQAGTLDAETSEPFTVEDGKVLREFVWLREAANFAVGNETDPMLRAERLFDWTVRNVQLIDAAAPVSAGVVDQRLPYLPWHLMVLGRGTALDRAWLFSQLARQQSLDVVLLAPGDAKPTPETPVWPALVHDGQLYLFDTEWSTAIPKSKDKGIATLADVQKDDALLRNLDLDQVGGKKFPLTADEAKKLTAYVDTSSPYLSPKFARVERLLAGDSKMVLSIDRDELVERVKKCAGVGRVEAWPLRDERFEASREKNTYTALAMMFAPFRALQGRNLERSPIWEARVKHLAGKYVDPLSGKPRLPRLYQDARPADNELKNLGGDREGFIYALRIKQNATYWLGLVSYDLGNYDTGVEYFKLVLRDAANGGWTTGARYNLGRTYEKMNEPAQAVETYRATILGVKPDAACLYRAKQLGER